MWRVVTILFLLPLAVSAQEGRAPNRVCEVVVEGNEHISDAAILAVVQTKPGQPFSKERVLADRDSILDMGWFQEVSVRAEPTPKGIRVVFSVVENRVVKSIEIEGNTVYKDEILLKVMETRPGQVFNTRLFWRDADRIRDLYARHGYVADVVDAYVDEQGVLHVVVLEFVVERIEIEGLRKTKPEVIRRVMRLKPGMVFNTGILGSDLARIEALGFFEEVEREVREGSEPGKAVVVIKVKEMKSGSVAGGLAYSSRYGLVGMLDFTELNFRGLAQRINLRAEFGENRDSWEFSYHIPWLDAKGTSVGLSIYDRLITQDFYYWGAPRYASTYYDERRRGFTLNFSRPLTDRFRLGITLRNEKVRRQNPHYVPEGI
ncbi:MAG TPA: FtsQ-type POTRA domain-containing protein, partial [Armatimonadetes bacterium]|nr:FtsQ-type POTRA domain-containing protein [Armatimonadota bacterium]